MQHKTRQNKTQKNSNIAIHTKSVATKFWETVLMPFKNEEDRKWADNQVKSFTEMRPKYKIFAKTLNTVLSGVMHGYAPESIVQTRAKSISSFAEKIWRKKDESNDPVNQFTDLCGGRIITHTPDEVLEISEFIENHFEIDWDNSVDVSQRLKPTEFGYRSIHYIVSFKPGVFPTKDIKVNIPEEIYNLKAEIQVRTLLEHAWADFSHLMIYKKEFKPPEKWVRELAAVAALLEEGDNLLLRAKSGLQVYANSYGTYMSEDQINSEIEILENVLKHDPDNVGIAHQIGRMAITLGNWEKAVEILSRHSESRNGPVLRDLGLALCKLHADHPENPEYKAGRNYLEEAIQISKDDPEAISSLAATWKGIDEKKAKKMYQHAFALDPSNPYPLNNYLDYEISEKRDLSIIPIIRPVIEEATRRSRDLADVGVGLPWSYYNMGKFKLLLENPYQALEMYAKAISVTSDAWMINSAIKSLMKIKSVRNELEGYEWILKLLYLGLAVKFPKEEYLNHLKELASEDVELKEPLIIVVVGTDSRVEADITGYREFLIEAFNDFKGTIISGGTTAGISGFIGEIQEYNPDNLETMGYIPKFISTDTTTDSRYSKLQTTEGVGFSALEPLQYWIDIISSGINPKNVKIIGINGGRISSAEFRLALSLGATVSVVYESGREAAKLLVDSDWNSEPNLITLPNDSRTVREFICLNIPIEDSSLRETLGRSIHEEYQKNQFENVKNKDPSMKNWEALNQGLKNSNLQQADHIFRKLQEVGYDLREIKGREIKITEFTDEEVEIMSEMEHGRWNAERLLDGWKWGKEKDVEKKISPYLVSWDELSEEVKEWDRQTVRKIPEFLASVGFEVYKINKDDWSKLLVNP